MNLEIKIRPFAGKEGAEEEIEPRED